jgi:hypothetical protein
MIKDELNDIKKNIELGVLHRDIDESYANGVWDLATNYVKNHYTHIHSTDMEKEMQVAILYDFIYDLLDEELENDLS